jgi:outer membrane lipoprotein-sorting protein
MRIHSARAALVLAALLAAAPASAADLHDLVRRSAVVDRSRSYQGTKVLTRFADGAPSSTTYKVYHLKPDRTLMSGYSGEHRGVTYLQIGRENYIRHAGASYYREPPLPPPPDNTRLLLQNYTLKQMRVEPIAMRKCVMVHLIPKHKGNPSKLMWLDTQTAMPLKMQIRAADGSLTEETEFRMIQYNPKLTARQFTLKGPVVSEWPEVTPDFAVVKVKDGGLPAGYTRADSLNRLTPAGHIVSLQRFSDGLNTITLLQSKTHPNLGLLGGRPAVEGKVGRVNFAICGEHDPKALRRIAASLRGRPLSIRPRQQ